MPESTDTLSEHKFLQGGGEMGELIRSIDWSQTPIGPVDTWPASLKIATAIMLSTPFPMYIAWGNSYTQLYNDGYRPILGSTKHPQAMGISTRETFAEIWHIIGSMFDGVMNGKAVGFPNFMLPLERNGYVEECFFDFSYSPISDEDGNIGGILVTVIETTEKVRLINRLKIKRENILNMVRKAPVGMCIIKGKPLFVEEINDRFLEIIGKRREQFLTNSFWEVNAEAAAYYSPITDHVLETGSTYSAKEREVMLIRNGVEEIVYVNFVYEPMKGSDGIVDAIMIVAIEVTNEVTAKKELENAYDQARLSKQAAELGIFDMDLIKGTMEWDERCRHLFGISHLNTVSYEHDFLPGLHPDDRERVMNIIDNVFIKSVSNGDYDVEYRTVGVEDQQVRWVRAKGKAYFNDQDIPYRFIGSVLDITETKQNEIRKNDFIAMVSHELKTPLTSLKALIQMVAAKATKNDDSFTAGALDRANNQVKKMTRMIDGFLNVSRLEKGKIPLEKTDFKLDDLIRSIAEEVGLTMHSYDIDCQLCEPVSVNADHDKVGQVINNLLTNAIKYSPEGALIEVACYVSEGMALVSVKDEGMGIKPNDIEKLFDRFYRVETKHTQNIAGFGIGLYLSAEIIQHHNGKIWVESEPGKGSTFYFSLPLQH